jgi:hypothetical protein
MDAERLQWNKDGEEALKRCNGDLKKYKQEFLEIRASRAASKERAIRRYGLPREVHGWRFYQNGDGETIEVETSDGRSLTQLGNIVAGLPKLPDHSIDAQLAAQVINQNFRDLAQSAAGDFLNARAMESMRSENVQAGHLVGTDPHRALLSDLLRRAMNEYPAVASVYNTGTVSVEALRAMLWPLLKTETREFEQRNYESLRRYEFERS